MIEANANTLSEFLKTKSSINPAVATNPLNNINPSVATPESSPLENLTSGMSSATDGIEKFTNLIEAVNKLINTPVVNSMFGGSRVVESSAPRVREAQVQEVPDGYLPANNLIESKPLPPKVQVPVRNNNPEMFYMALLKMVEEISKQAPERTIKSIYDELNQESVKEVLIKQIEVLM